MALPIDWDEPKYGLGQRTKQGIIVGMDYYPAYTTAGYQIGSTWRYGVLAHPLDDADYTKYLNESEVELLSPEEVKAQVQKEIDFHVKHLQALKTEIMLSECAGISMVGNSVFVTCESDQDFIALVKKEMQLICHLTGVQDINQIILVSKEGRRTNFYPKSNH